MARREAALIIRILKNIYPQILKKKNSILIKKQLVFLILFVTAAQLRGNEMEVFFKWNMRASLCFNH